MICWISFEVIIMFLKVISQTSIMNTKQKSLFRLPILSALVLSVLLFIPFVAADMASPVTPFGNVPPILQLVMLFCINLIINAAIIFACFKGLNKYALPKAGRVNGLVVALITLIGFIIDGVVIFLIAALFSSLHLFRYNVLSPILQLLFLFVGVGLLVAATSYTLLFKKHLKQKYAWRASIIFGIISNPAWIALVLIIFSSVIY